MDRQDMYGEEIPVVGYTDNMNLNEAVQSLQSVENKRTRIEIAYLKELVEQGEVEKVV